MAGRAPTAGQNGLRRTTEKAAMPGKSAPRRTTRPTLCPPTPGYNRRAGADARHGEVVRGRTPRTPCPPTPGYDRHARAAAKPDADEWAKKKQVGGALPEAHQHAEEVGRQPPCAPPSGSCSNALGMCSLPWCGRRGGNGSSAPQAPEAPSEGKTAQTKVPPLGERSGERLLWTRKKPSPSGAPSSRGGWDIDEA